jgi:hypothetical protein
VIVWVYLLAMAQEGASIGCDFRSGETSVWMFYGLGNAVKNYVVISWSCTEAWGLASDEITNMWVKLCNLCRV